MPKARVIISLAGIVWSLSVMVAILIIDPFVASVTLAAGAVLIAAAFLVATILARREARRLLEAMLKEEHWQ